MDGLMNAVYGVIEHFVITFDSAIYIEVAVKFCGLMGACKSIQLFD